MKSYLLVLLFQFFILFVCCQPVQKLDDYNIANVSNNEVQHRYRRTLKQRPPQCNVNQYYDEEEGRCLGVVGGGRVLYVNNTKSCGMNILKPHCNNPRYYYICKKNRTILAQCGHGRHFDNRLQKCVPVSKQEYVSATISPNADSYEPLEIPDCRKQGSFPVPDECALFYTCESNGHRLYQSFYRCPKDMAYNPMTNLCAFSSTCNDVSPWWCASNVKKENFTLEEVEKSMEISMQFTFDEENSTFCETIFATDEEITNINPYDSTEISSYEITTVITNLDSSTTDRQIDSITTDRNKLASTITSNTEQTIPELAESDDKSDITRTTERASEASRTTNIVDDTTVSYSGTETTPFNEKTNLENNTEIGITKPSPQEFATTVDNVPTEKPSTIETEKIVEGSSTEGIDQKFTTKSEITTVPIFITTLSSRTDIVTEPSSTINNQGTDEAVGEIDQKSNTKTEITFSTPATSINPLLRDTTETKQDTFTGFSTTAKSTSVTKPEAIVEDTDKPIQSIVEGSNIKIETTSSIPITSTDSLVHDTREPKLMTTGKSMTTEQLLGVTTLKSTSVTEAEAIVNDPDKKIQSIVDEPINKIDTTTSTSVSLDGSLVHDTTETQMDASTKPSTIEQLLEITTKPSTSITEGEPIVGGPDKESQTNGEEPATKIETTSSNPATSTTSSIHDTSKPKLDTFTEFSTTEQILEVTTEKRISITEPEAIVGDLNTQTQTTIAASTKTVETTSSSPLVSLVHNTSNKKMETSTKPITAEQILEGTTRKSNDITEADPIVSDLNKETQTAFTISTSTIATTSAKPMISSDSLVQDAETTKMDSSTKPSTTEQLLEITTDKSTSITEAERIVDDSSKETQAIAEGPINKFETSSSIPETSTTSLVYGTRKTEMDISTESSTPEQLLEVSTSKSPSITKAEPIVEDLNNETQTTVTITTPRIQTTTFNPLASLMHDISNVTVNISMKPSTVSDFTTRKSITEAEAIVNDPAKEIRKAIQGHDTQFETTTSIPATSTTSLVHDTSKPEIDTSTKSSTTEQSLDFTTRKSISVTEAEQIVEDPDEKTTTSIPVSSTGSLIRDTSETTMESFTKPSTSEQLIESSTKQSTSVTEAESIIGDLNKETQSTVTVSTIMAETITSIPLVSPHSLVQDTSNVKMDTSMKTSTTEQMLEVTTMKGTSITEAEAIVNNPAKEIQKPDERPITNIETTSSIPVNSPTSLAYDAKKPDMDTSTKSSTTEQSLDVTTGKSNSVTEAEQIVEDPNKEIQTTVTTSRTKVEATTSIPVSSTSSLIRDTTITKMDTSTKPSTTEQMLEVTAGRSTSITEAEAIVNNPAKEIQKADEGFTTNIETTSSISTTSSTTVVHDTSRPEMDTSTKSSTIEQLLDVTTRKSISGTEAEQMVENPNKEIQTTVAESQIEVETTTSIPVSSTGSLIRDTSVTKMDTSTKPTTNAQTLEITTGRSTSVTKAEPIVGDLNNEMQTTFASVETTSSIPLISSDSLHDTSKTKMDSSVKSTTEQMLEVTTRQSISTTKPEAIVEDPDKEYLQGSTPRFETTTSDSVTSTTPSLPDTSNMKINTFTKSTTSEETLDVTTEQSTSATEAEAIRGGPDKETSTHVAESNTRAETTTSTPVTLTDSFDHTSSNSKSNTIAHFLQVTTSKSSSVTDAEAMIQDPEEKSLTTVKRSTTKIETTSSIPEALTDSLVQDTSETKIDTSTKSSISDHMSKGTTVGPTKPEAVIEDSTKKGQNTVEGSTTRIGTSSSSSVPSTTPSTHDTSEMKMDTSPKPSIIEPASAITAGEKSISVAEAQLGIEDPATDIKTVIEESMDGNTIECSPMINANDTASNTVHCANNQSTPRSNDVPTAVSPSIQALLAYCRAYALAEAAKKAANNKKHSIIAKVNETLKDSEEVVGSEKPSKHIAFPIASAVLSIADKFERRLKEVLKDMLH